MMHSPARTCVALALCLNGAFAHANATADARLSDLRIQLFPIGTGDPAVLFTSADGSLVHVLANSAMSGLAVDDSVAGIAPLSPVGLDCPSNPNVACHARIAGDPWAGRGAVDVAASAGDAVSAQVEATAYLAGGTNYATFELSADTVMVITAVADLYAQASGNGLDYASSSAYLNLTGSLGDDSQSSSANALALAGGPFGDQDVRRSFLSVSFVNAFGRAIEGSLFGGIDATAVSSVAEPASAWLLLAGLLALASWKAASRRRRVAPQRQR
jgi:hypothetical protein